MMGVTLDWYDAEKTILFYKFVGKWNWDQFWQCWDQSLPGLNELDHSFSVIMDLSESKTIPSDALVHLRKITRSIIPTYSGFTVYVGIGRLGEMYERLMRTVNPGLLGKIKMFFVPTVEDALRILREVEDRNSK